MKISNLGDITLRALRCLQDSGSKSFEQLTANLLSDLLGFPIRLCKSGEQGGIDALAEIPIAIEDKRYHQKKLDEVELEGKLSAAARSYPDLQLWILISTAELSAQAHEALKRTAENLGLGILVLDKASVQPHLPTVSTVSALAATNIAMTLQAVSNPEWRDSKKAANMPPASEVECDLRSICALPHFSEWVARLRDQLRELPLWRLVVERQNRRLAKLIEGDAYTSLGTVFDPSKVVSRTAKGQFADWLIAATRAVEPEIVIVLGERYDGKTWCVFDWLRDQLQKLSLPVFFVGSNRGINSEKSLEDHILNDIKRVLGSSFGRHTEALVRRQRSMEMGSTPWCLVVLDGLNEYHPSVSQCLNHIAWAIGRQDLAQRPGAVLVTVRQQSWSGLKTQVPGQKREIQIGPYDDREFRDALQLEGLPENYLTSIPDKAHLLVRRPRYLGLVSKHQDQLGAYSAITPDVLHWLDACDKITRSESTSGQRLDAKGYQEVLKNLVTRYRESGFLNRTVVLEAIGELAANPRAALSELESEGVLKDVGTGYDVASDRLALGMGLWLLEKLKSAYRKKENLLEILRDHLSPDQETEEKIAWLRSASIVALLITPQPSEEIIAVLVDTWLRSRNLSLPDFQDIKVLRSLLQPLLRLAPETWSSEGGESRLQELSRMVFADAVGERRELISEAVKRWFRLVPRAGSWAFQKLKEGKDPTGLVQSEVNASELADLELQICGDEGVLGLHRVGLFLLNKAPDLVGPQDLLALLVAKAIAHDSLGDGERFIIRRALAKTDAGWFVGEVGKVLGCPPSRWRNSLYHLMTLAEREELVSLAETIKPPVDPQWEFWERGRIKNRSRYEEVSSQPFAEEDNPAHFIREVSELVCDPNLPQPCESRLTIIREVFSTTFANAELGNFLGHTVKDSDFERMLPAMAAWAQDVGATIMHRQMMSLPGGVSRKPLWWLLELRRHAVLVEGPARSALMKALSADRSDSADGQLGKGAVLLTLFPGMNQTERIDALLRHPLKDWEWTELYDTVAPLLNEEGKAELVHCLRSENDPLQIRRAYYLLGSLDKVILTPGEIKSLINKFEHGSEADQLAALRLAAVADVKTLTLELLLPLAANPNEPRSLLPNYASWLLINGDALKTATYAEVISRLRPRWRALAAIKRPDFCQVFLKEIELTLNPDSVLQQAMFQTPVHIKRKEDDALPDFQYALAPELWTHSLHIRRSETTTGGVAWLTNDALQEVTSVFEGRGTAAERYQKLQQEVETRFVACCRENETCWAFEQFPYTLVKQLYEQDRPCFEQWLSCLLADKVRAKNWWGGLLIPIFQVMLHTGDRRVKEIWKLVSPFQRERSSAGATFVIDGIHWGFHELSAANADDGLSNVLLKDLICGALSDQELFYIALGARSQGPKRLTEIIKELLENPEAEIRARAVNIAGWLEGMAQFISKVEQGDQSLWVRKVAKEAFRSQQLETWARHWFNVFLTETHTEARWGAGQLFLTCVDARFRVWAWPILNQSNLPTRVRGEALLLLEEARKLSEKGEQKLRDSFLLHKINDLKAVCDPWHPTVDWEQLVAA